MHTRVHVRCMCHTGRRVLVQARRSLNEALSLFPEANRPLQARAPVLVVACKADLSAPGVPDVAAHVRYRMRLDDAPLPGHHTFNVMACNAMRTEETEACLEWIDHAMFA